MANKKQGRCKDCRHWVALSSAGDGDLGRGECNSNETIYAISMRVVYLAPTFGGNSLHRDAALTVSGRIFTAPAFGCVHFELKPGRTQE